MDAKEFDKRLTERLNSLKDSEISTIRKQFNSEGDYGVDEYGRSYWIPLESIVNLKLNDDYRSPNIDLISDNANIKSKKFFVKNNDTVKVNPVVNKGQKLDLKVNPVAA